MKTILLVDDEAPMRRLIQITLGDARRYRVLQAGDGAEALQALKSTPVDVVLLDIHMPVLDGFRTCEAIAGLPPERRPKVIMLTARAGTAERERGKALGADEYLTKPFSPMALLDCLDRLLAAPAASTSRAA